LQIGDCRSANSKAPNLQCASKKQFATRNLHSAIVAVLLCFTAAPLGAAGLTNPEPLAKAYDLILDARGDEAAQQLRTACGPAPATGCLVLQAVAAYWQLLSDPENTSHDAEVLRKVDAAVASAEAWVAREPKRAEAWFYLGGAYGTRVLMRGMLRDELLSAARDGRRIHDALQRSVALDPSLQDAYFGLGLYHYYAAVAPAAARVLRVLFFLPAGDRAGGLREMQQTENRGLLLRGEADYQLHLIYLWYEGQPMTALKLVEGLRLRYPHNPLFALRTAIIQNDAFHNASASLQIYRSLLESALAGRVAFQGITEVNARLGMAQELDLLCDYTHAIEQLRVVIAGKPAAPYSSTARAYYQLGAALDRSGRRSDALAAYRSALAAIPPDDRLQLGAKVREGLKRPAIGRICR
jgi:tetratricopeptide (TPR) repeat protein